MAQIWLTANGFESTSGGSNPQWLTIHQATRYLTQDQPDQHIAVDSLLRRLTKDELVYWTYNM